MAEALLDVVVGYFDTLLALLGINAFAITSHCIEVWNDERRKTDIGAH